VVLICYSLYDKLNLLTKANSFVRQKNYLILDISRNTVYL